MKHDYQCNAALSLLKTLKTELGETAPKNPREVAQSIVNAIPGILEEAGQEVCFARLCTMSKLGHSYEPRR